MAWKCIPPEMTVKCLRSVAYPMQWVGLMMIYCRMTVKRMGMLGVRMRQMQALSVKIQALSVKMETVTLIGKGR